MMAGVKGHEGRRGIKMVRVKMGQGDDEDRG